MSKEEPKPAEAEAKPEDKKNDGSENKEQPNPDNTNDKTQPQTAKPKFGNVPIEIINTVLPVQEVYLNSNEEKFELERVRRWKIKIEEIQVSPTPIIFDCFIQITIGGDYQLYAVHNIQKQTSCMKRTGQRGYTVFSECRETDIKSPTIYECSYDLELRDSIVNLMRQNLVIELWDYNVWSPNTYKGIGMIP